MNKDNEHETIILSAQAYDALTAAINDVSPPPAQLVALMQRKPRWADAPNKNPAQ